MKKGWYNVIRRGKQTEEQSDAREVNIMDTNTRIVGAVRKMASAIARILGTPDIDTTVTINEVTVFDEKVEK